MLRHMVMVKRPAASLVALMLVSACASTGDDQLRAGDSSRPAESPETAAVSASPGYECADGTQPAALPSPPPAAFPPSGTTTTNEIDLEIYADCKAVRVGQPVRLRVIASGSHHEPAISGFRIEGMTSSSQPACMPEEPNEQPSPAVTVQDIEYAYKKPGEDLVVVNADTFCSRFSGIARAELLLDVRP